jgi:hypothetical protein
MKTQTSLAKSKIIPFWIPLLFLGFLGFSLQTGIATPLAIPIHQTEYFSDEAPKQFRSLAYFQYSLHEDNKPISDWHLKEIHYLLQLYHQHTHLIRLKSQRTKNQLSPIDFIYLDPNKISTLPEEGIFLCFKG